MKFVSLNNKILPASEATISPFDQGFQTGLGIFETIKVTDSGSRLFSYHYERLKSSADRLDLVAPSQEKLEALIVELLEKNQVEQARLRITLPGGEAPVPDSAGKSTLLITLAALPDYPESAAVVTVPFTRTPDGALAGIKSTSYGESVVALRYAKNKGADEAIFLNSLNYLCEGSTSNLFLIYDASTSD